MQYKVVDPFQLRLGAKNNKDPESVLNEATLGGWNFIGTVSQAGYSQAVFGRVMYEYRSQLVSTSDLSNVCNGHAQHGWEPVEMTSAHNGIVVLFRRDIDQVSDRGG